MGRKAGSKPVNKYSFKVGWSARRLNNVLAGFVSSVEDWGGGCRFSVAYGSPFKLQPQSDLPLLHFLSPNMLWLLFLH